MRRAIFFAVALIGPVGAVQAQVSADSIRGQVLTDSGSAIVSAEVVVTIVPTAESVRAQTDSAGRFIVNVSGHGEYLLYVSSLGRQAFRKRISRVQGDSAFVLTIRLAAVVQSLAPITVVTSKPRPSRAFGMSSQGAGTNGTDKTVDGLIGALNPNNEGDIASLSSLVPGVNTAGPGVTAFGIAAGQSITTLNGLEFPGFELPRSARKQVRVALSPWDPAVGGFSSLVTDVSIGSGSNISDHRAQLLVQNDLSTSSSLYRSGFKLTRPRNLSLDDGGAGPLQLDRSYYSYGAHLGYGTNSNSSLLGRDQGTLRSSGLNADSIAHFLSVLALQGIPVGDAKSTTAQSRDGSFVGRLDFFESQPNENAPPPPASTIISYAHYADHRELGGPTSLPSLGGRASNAQVWLQAIHSRYLGAKGLFANQSSAAISYSAAQGRPDFTLPRGIVYLPFVQSGTASSIPVSFGGNSFRDFSTNRVSLDFVNQTNFLFRNSSSTPAKLYVRSSVVRERESLSRNSNGTFTYGSLDALSQNHPESFSRLIQSSASTSSRWTSAAALGGDWHRGNIVFTGGARLDLDMFLDPPSVDSAIRTAFNVSEPLHRVQAGVSPRIGFAWNYLAQTGSRSSGSSLWSINQGPSQIRGGVGLFRGILPSDLLRTADQRSGRQSGPRAVNCLGSSTPVPLWESYRIDAASIPSSCASDGVFGADVPTVSILDKNLSAPQSWRGSVGWTGNTRAAYLAIDGTFSMNRRQLGLLDLNFQGRPKFTLPDGRPVYVEASSFDLATGRIVASGARVSSAFGSVVESVDDLSGIGKTLSAYVIPSLPERFGLLTVSYALSIADWQRRGFDGTTGSDPRLRERYSNDFVPRHTLVVQAAHSFEHSALTATLRATSGLPFTPVVSADINGDGFTNDRAFVFDPAVNPEAIPASEMKKLLQNRNVSTCLTHQLNRIAKPNSCVGSGYVSSYLSLVVPDLPIGQRRAQARITLSNLASGLDLVLHGSAAHGWGEYSIPDPQLYRVVGFDMTRKQFRYELNSRFARNVVGTSANPFQVSVNVSVDLGRSPREQRLVQDLRVQPSLSRTRATPAQIKRRIILRSYTDIYGFLIANADSLALSREQVEQMTNRRKIVLSGADSLYTSLSVYLAELPTNVDARLALVRIDSVNIVAWDAIRVEIPFLKAILTGGQLRLLPRDVFSFITDPNFKRRFFFGGYSRTGDVP